MRTVKSDPDAPEGEHGCHAPGFDRRRMLWYPQAYLDLDGGKILQASHSVQPSQRHVGESILDRLDRSGGRVPTVKIDAGTELDHECAHA